MNKKNVLMIAILLLLTIIVVLLVFKNFKDNNNEQTYHYDGALDFDFKMIQEVNKGYKDNYLISPLSIAYALNMVNEGSNGQTKEQINNLLGNYKINTIKNIKNKINIANGLFINNNRKDIINDDFVNTIKTKYEADTIYDEFTSPKVINDWVSEKTYNMIPELMDDLDSELLMIIANTIAIDVEWRNTFLCKNTKEEKFYKNDETINTPMMYTNEDVEYIENKNAKGIIKKYRTYFPNDDETINDINDGVSLEYIAILPNDDLDSYINNFNRNELNDLLESKNNYSNYDVNLKLPKYTYDFDYDKFKKDLMNLGMVDAFTPYKADLSNIADNLYISEAIHKTHIELSENGTKAAAVTAFAIKANSAFEQKKEIDITFNKPFIYIIKETNNDNIWFFGKVTTPMKWEDNSSCETNYEG